jgi:acetolactate synthase-1/2/3 large subunit
MGMKLAQPERDVFNIMGDAAFGMTGLDIETAVRNRIGIVTVLLNNSAMGNYETHMPLAVERYGAKRLGGHYTKVAEAMGAFARRVTKPAELDRAFTEAIESARGGMPAVLECITAEEPAMSGYVASEPVHAVTS